MKRSLAITLILTILVNAGSAGLSTVPTARADGFVDFENGVDGQAIRSSIPGLQFTTTAGQDWLYGDWRTGQYHGPYPQDAYYSNGNFFAWLGPNQGAGRIDFTGAGATYLQVSVSSAEGLTMDGYYEDNTKAATASVGGNLWTGQLARLRVDAPPGRLLKYVILHDTGNYWLIDDLSTDASGVPHTRPPVIIIPGLLGSSLWNKDSCLGFEYEVWPSPALLALPFDLHLNVLKLDKWGMRAASPCADIRAKGIIDWELRGFIKVYGPLIEELKRAGFNVYTFDYDWRLDLRENGRGSGHEGQGSTEGNRSAASEHRSPQPGWPPGAILCHLSVGSSCKGGTGHLPRHPLPWCPESAQSVALGRCRVVRDILDHGRSRPPADGTRRVPEPSSHVPDPAHRALLWSLQGWLLSREW